MTSPPSACSPRPTYAAPIDVLAHAKLAGAQVVRHHFDDGDISGMLYRDDTRTVIGLNSTQSPTRQRFTVAHELGHLKLHPGRPSSSTPRE